MEFFGSISIKRLRLPSGGLESVLTYNSLRMQVSAILTMSNHIWAFNPLVTRFLKAAVTIWPSVKSYTPKSDLSLVLKALPIPHFELVTLCSQYYLTLQTLFLIAVASTRRVLELCALLVKEPYCLVLQDGIVLRPVLSFLSNVSTSSFMNW